jgi:hypothetical protein
MRSHCAIIGTSDRGPGRPGSLRTPLDGPACIAQAGTSALSAVLLRLLCGYGLPIGPQEPWAT